MYARVRFVVSRAAFSGTWFLPFNLPHRFARFGQWLAHADTHLADACEYRLVDLLGEDDCGRQGVAKGDVAYGQGVVASAANAALWGTAVEAIASLLVIE